MQDVNINIGYENIADVSEKFKQDEIDAVIIAEPISTEIIRSGKAHTLALSNDIEEHHADCVFVARKDLIESPRETVAELVDALVRAGGFINAYPRQSAEIGSKFLGWPKDLLLEALTHDKGHILFWDLLPRLQDFEYLQKIAVHKLHLWENEIDLSSFINPEFAQSAYRGWVIDVRKQVKDRGSERTLPGNFASATNLFQNAIGKSVSVIGIKNIGTGEKYPLHINRQPLPHTISMLRDDVNRHGKIVFEILQNDLKAIYLFNNADIAEPDTVLFELSKANADRCITALSFGQDRLFEIQKVPIGHLFSDETILFGKENDGIWCKLDYNVFRFLGLLLQNFAQEK